MSSESRNLLRIRFCSVPIFASSQSEAESERWCNFLPNALGHDSTLKILRACRSQVRLFCEQCCCLDYSFPPLFQYIFGFRLAHHVFVVANSGCIFQFFLFSRLAVVVLNSFAFLLRYGVIHTSRRQSEPLRDRDITRIVSCLCLHIRFCTDIRL